MKHIGLLNHLDKVMHDAAQELSRCVEKQYPIGTEIKFNIRRDQKNSSTGTVEGYSKPGVMRVKHHQAKKYSRYSYRDVHFREVIQ